MTRKQQIVKRIFDITASAALIMLFSPVLLVISLLVKISSKGSIIFKQERVGKDGNLFNIYKFRSMVPNAVNMGTGLYLAGLDDPRITRVGRVIRRTSIDELPQLFNVFKGEMSLIGPRPTMMQQVINYSEFQRKRLLVKPGITGWAQVQRRGVYTEWPERIKQDVWYVENYSFWLDLKILLKTITVVWRSAGFPSTAFIEERQNFSKREGG